MSKLSLHRIPTGDAAVRELMAVREIVQAFLTATRPEDVFQLALERVSPLVGAAFASVYLAEDGARTLRHAASYNWPERYRPFLGEMRVRIGHGPSGEAVSKRRVIEVPDIFADAALADWRDVATELGFRAIVALPLQTSDRVLGAVAFYFSSAGGFTAETRSLVRIVADQMAGTAEKAGLIEELRRMNTQLQETNAALAQQNLVLMEARKIKDEFLANMSHELRTPLTAVIGYVSLMEEGLVGPLTSDQETTLAQVKASSAQLLEMIQSVLELASLRKGESEVVIEAIDIAKLLDEAVGVARTPPGGVTLIVEPLPAGVPVLHGDRRKIVKIIAALLVNAYKFSTGEVHMSAQVRGERVSITVRDAGIGIAPLHHELIFDEFRQIDGSATRRYGGAGLGLALARQLARLLDGDVHVHSALGEGSTFTLELPLKPAPVLAP